MRKTKGTTVGYIGTYEVKCLAPRNYAIHSVIAGGKKVATAQTLKDAINACYKHKADTRREAAV